MYIHKDVNLNAHIYMCACVRVFDSAVAFVTCPVMCEGV